MRKFLSLWAFVVLAMSTTKAMAYDYQTCIKWDIQTIDSGRQLGWGPNLNLTEDKYISCDGGCQVVARGARVRVSKGSWSQVYYTDASTGCFDWSHSSTSGFTVSVGSEAKNSHNTTVRVHNGSTTNFSTTPGISYGFALYNVRPSRWSRNTYVVGTNSQIATLSALAAYTIYRVNIGNYNKTIHIARDTSECWSSSSAYGTNTGSTQQVTSGRHYVRIGSCAVGSPSARRKFVVSHELGHALLRLYTNKNGNEPNQDSSHNVSPNTCEFGGTSYNIDSKEWNSKGFKEGFAHLLSAKTWNNRHQLGVFTWSGTPHSLERYLDPANPGQTSSGGRLENICCTGAGCASSYQDAATISDWMRFLWDVYSEDNMCSERWDLSDMFRLYDQFRDRGGASSTNYYEVAKVSATEIGLSTCAGSTLFTSRAAWNGVDN